MCNKKWDFRELKDTERKEGKIRYWEFLFRAWEKEKKLANNVKMATQGWVYNEVEKIDFTWVFFV